MDAGMTSLPLILDDEPLGIILRAGRDSAVRENGKTIVVVDVDAVLNKGRLEKDITLEPGDLIIVPERGVVFGN